MTFQRAKKKKRTFLRSFVLHSCLKCKLHDDDEADFKTAPRARSAAVHFFAHSWTAACLVSQSVSRRNSFVFVQKASFELASKKAAAAAGFFFVFAASFLPSGRTQNGPDQRYMRTVWHILGLCRLCWLNLHWYTHLVTQVSFLPLMLPKELILFSLCFYYSFFTQNDGTFFIPVSSIKIGLTWPIISESDQ